MNKKPALAALLSALVPGLGQIYSDKAELGMLILIATIIVGNLNAIWLSLYATTDLEKRTFWAVELPRILHDVFAIYGLIFLAWQIWDAYQLAKNRKY